MDKLISRINTIPETVSLGGTDILVRVSTGREDGVVPRNSIEEFDPGSA